VLGSIRRRTAEMRFAGKPPRRACLRIVSSSGARVDVYNLADENVTERYEFGGSPWKKEYAKAYEQMSPSSYMGAITTPTLILHDISDPRVPITSSYAMYHALKDNGVTVKFIALPIAGHEPADPVHQSDWYRLWVEWFDQYLK